MEEERCFRCDRNEGKVRLLDAVYNNEIVKICEECSVVENIPIIRKPSSFQLVESEKLFTVRERLRRMAGLKDDKQEKVKEVMRKISDVKIDDLRKPKDYKKILEEKYNLAKKRNLPINLVDNYNWYILLARKKRKMTRNQLAIAVGESEIAIKMIENKEMPDDTLRIINKIEQYLGIKLRKDSNQEFTKIIEKKIADKESKEQKKTEEKPEPEKNKIEPARILKFDEETSRKLTIADLVRMKREKEKAMVEKSGIDISKVVWGNKDKEREGGEKEKTSEGETLIGSEIEFEE